MEVDVVYVYGKDTHQIPHESTKAFINRFINSNKLHKTTSPPYDLGTPESNQELTTLAQSLNSSQQMG